MAAAIFEQRLREAGSTSGWQIASAGTWTREGLPAARRAQSVMQEWGIDIQAHRSRQISGDLLATANLVVVMTSNHREALTAEFPGDASRICRLGDLAGVRYDIPDPINGSLDDVRIVARELDTLLTTKLDVFLETARALQPSTEIGSSHDAMTQPPSPHHDDSRRPEIRPVPRSLLI